MITLDRAPKWNLYQPQIFKLSLCISLLLVVALMNYTSYSFSKVMPVYFESVEDLETIPIRTEKAKVVQKLKPIIVDPVPVDLEEIDEDEIEYVDEINETVEPSDVILKDAVLTSKPIVKEEVVAPPLPPEIIETEGEVKPFLFVENMPLFGDCANEPNEMERRACSDASLLKYIYEYLNYPAIARENGIEGRVILEFVVDNAGNILNAKVLHDIGGGCGAEAMRVVNEMDGWIPGRQNGKKVSVLYRLPVMFKLL